MNGYVYFVGTQAVTLYYKSVGDDKMHINQLLLLSVRVRFIHVHSLGIIIFSINC